MNYRERYLVRREARAKAEEWTNSASNRFGLLYYWQQNSMRIEASSDLWVMTETGKSPVQEEFVLNFYFSLFGIQGEDYYLRRIEFKVDGNGMEWCASESALEPPVSLADFLQTAPPEVRGKAEKGPIFYEMYEGIYSRLFPFVEHEDVHAYTNEEY